jgi:metal-responsive CopG/Arc/MetJ family transcriptional regulator
VIKGGVVDNTVIRELVKQKITKYVKEMAESYRKGESGYSFDGLAGEMMQLLAKAELRGRESIKYLYEDSKLPGDVLLNAVIKDNNAHIAELTKQLEACDCVLGDGACEEHEDK